MSRAKSESTRFSPFAQTMRALLDDTGFFSRKEWADFLSVTPPALTQWVRDQTIPRADLLSMVVDLLRLRGGEAAREPLSAFDRLRSEPAPSISPHGARFGASLDEYLRSSVLDFARSLRGMTAEQQAVLIKSGANPVGGVSSAAERRGQVKDARHEDTGLASWSNSEAVSSGASWGLSSAPISSRISPRFIHEEQDGSRRSAGLGDVLNHRKVVVRGAPGSGKSTSLMLLKQAFESRGETAKFVNLRNCRKSDVDAIFVPDRHTPAQTLLLDGLDEVDGNARSAVADAIAEASARWPQIAVVVASRPVPELVRFAGFETMSIAPLTDVDLVHSAALQVDDRESGGFDRFFCHLAERNELRQPMRNPIFFKSALRLFQQSAVTPFWEADIVREFIRALFDQDQHKSFSRIREPWASTHQLPNLLGEISYCSLRERAGAFDREDLRRWLSGRDELFLDRLEDFLQIQGFIIRDETNYRFTYGVVRDYLAAQYAVDSAEDATRFLKGWRQHPNMRTPLRIACSLATDASPLMRSVMDEGDVGGDINVLLADILAQPLSVDEDLLDASCLQLVTWLDRETSSWTKAKMPKQEIDPAVWWFMVLQIDADVASFRSVATALKSVHRARSGPAHEPLKRHLARSRSAFLPLFATAMEVDGRLSCRFNNEEGPGALTFAVEGPQFV